MASSFTKQQITEIAKQYKIADVSRLRKIIECAEIKYKELSNRSMGRISSDQVLPIKKFQKTTKKALKEWKNIPDSSRDLVYAVSPIPDDRRPEKSIDYSCEGLSELELMMVADLEAQKNETNRIVEHGLQTILDLVAISIDTFRPKTKLSNIPLRNFINILIKYWEKELGNKVTYSQDGSPALSFIEDIIKKIDNTQKKKVKGLLQVITKEQRNQKSRDKIHP